MVDSPRQDAFGGFYRRKRSKRRTNRGLPSRVESPRTCKCWLLTDSDWSGFENLSFEFGTCFGFRVSDFGFVLAGQRCPAEKMSDMLRFIVPPGRVDTPPGGPYLLPSCLNWSHPMRPQGINRKLSPS